MALPALLLAKAGTAIAVKSGLAAACAAIATPVVVPVLVGTGVVVAAAGAYELCKKK